MNHLLHSQVQFDGMRTSVLSMAAEVDQMLRRVLKAFLERDAALAQQVIDSDDQVDAMDNALDEQCLQLLALVQPVAADLRSVVAAMRITSELERIADEACNIAENTQALAVLPPTQPHPVMRAFSEHAATMYRLAIEALRTGGADTAREVCALETRADELHQQAVEVCFSHDSNELESTKVAVLRIFISRSLERICDIATNIAELVVFASEGAVIKHRWQGTPHRP